MATVGLTCCLCMPHYCLTACGLIWIEMDAWVPDNFPRALAATWKCIDAAKAKANGVHVTCASMLFGKAQKLA